MSTAAAKTRYTPEQYLALERKADFKSEFCNGFIVAMSGATRFHNLAAGNLFREISGQLKGGPCEAYIADMRVRVTRTGLYTYPDIVAVCGEPQLLDSEFDTLLNPTLIVEVLSPSTEAYDRGAKFRHYRRLESLHEYVLISQDRAIVERFARRGEDWVLTEWRGLDAVLLLDSVGCEVPLREIYDRTGVTAVDPPGPDSRSDRLSRRRR